MKRFHSLPARAAVVVLTLSLFRCVSTGADPVVVHAERVLIAAPGIYDTAMTWAEKNRATIPPQTLVALEKLRWQFPLVYRTGDAALQTYKAAKKASEKPDATALLEAASSVERLLAQLSVLVVSAGGPQLWPVPGGAP